MRILQSRQLVWLVFIIILFMLLVNNGLTLWDQDEAAYAGFGKRMLETGDWLIPNYPWSDVHRKTPFHFWNIATMFSFFGVSEFTMRLSSVAYIWGTCLILFFGLRKYLGAETMLLAVVVLASSFLVPSLAKIAVTDATLLFFSTLCALSIIKVLQDFKWYWVGIFWLSFAFALLTKGPPIIIFTGCMAIGVLIFYPKRWNLLKFHPWIGLPLACLPLYFWGKATVAVDDGVFISWMYDWYVLKRISGSVFGQTGPPGTHLLGIFGFFLPYLIFIPALIKDSIQSFKSKNETHFLVVLWFIAGWLIYEFSASKLPAYVIVAHVPFAILIARSMLNIAQRKTINVFQWKVVLTIFISLISAGISVAPFLLDGLESLEQTAVWLGFGFEFVCIVLIWGSEALQLKNYALAWLLFQCVCWTIIYPKVDNLHNTTRLIAEDLHDQANSNSTIVIANSSGRPPSLFYYLEQYFGQVREEKQADKLLDAYQSDTPTVLILSEKLTDKLDLNLVESDSITYSAKLADRKDPVKYVILLNKAAQKD